MHTFATKLEYMMNQATQCVQEQFAFEMYYDYMHQYSQDGEFTLSLTMYEAIVAEHAELFAGRHPCPGAPIKHVFSGTSIIGTVGG
jgi:hypothetical protein